jgi:hypothetical protein
MTVGLVICGALGQEVNALITQHQWDAEIVALRAVNHVFPERIAPDVEKKILALRTKYDHLAVVYGECGSKGELDFMLANYPDIRRISGPHCYEIYSGELFEELLAEEPGTYFLTDFMVRTFNGLIIKSMGLDRFPSLKKEYFRNYTRICYLMQVDLEEYRNKAYKIAEYLELPLQIYHVGYGELETRLAELMTQFGINAE